MPARYQPQKPNLPNLQPCCKCGNLPKKKGFCPDYDIRNYLFYTCSCYSDRGEVAASPNEHKARNKWNTLQNNIKKLNKLFPYQELTYVYERKTDYVVWLDNSFRKVISKSGLDLTLENLFS
jgi:ribosomal protein L15